MFRARHLVLTLLAAACSTDGATPTESDTAWRTPDVQRHDARPDGGASGPDADGAARPDAELDADGGSATVDARDSGQGDAPTDASADVAAPDVEPQAVAARPHAWGAWPDDDGEHWTFRLRAPAATRVELLLFDAPTGTGPVETHVLESDGAGGWAVRVPLGGAGFYGYRLWGPNWTWDPAWEPGSEAGFIADVDADGHRFNPNKVVLDPYALEMTHDPFTEAAGDGGIYRSGPETRALDSALLAPRGVLLAPRAAAEAGPTRPLRDDVVYEVHVRGLTMHAQEVPEALRGTYAGAALMAPYLAELGVTAIEFLPLHETQNDQNDRHDGSAGDNYWGYASLSFFAPDRRYAADQSPGGPTREVQAMVRAFHDAGIKVFVDVVYNHTGEGGSWGERGEYANLLSWRGVDNAGWYQTVAGSGYRNDNGVGPNLRFTERLVRDGVLDSLRYWHEVLGVDGFRFDLASVLGNACEEDCFRFEASGLLTEIAALARDAEGQGVDLIAEPWGTSEGTYQLGSYPAGWHEWNDRFRIAVRRGQNAPQAVTPAELAMRLHGSSDRFRDDGRGPDAGVSYVVSHDGFTLADLHACAERDNDQPWPWGPSDGGSTWNDNSDWGGDPLLQRQAARTSFALMAVSAGVPMLTGGDEFLRTQRCNNNPYNIDSPAMWLDWTAAADAGAHTTFVQRMLAFRHAQPALRPAAWTEGVDRDGDGRLDIAWWRADGQPLESSDWDDVNAPVLAWSIDADEGGAGARAIYVAWNRSDALVDVTLPPPPEGTPWRRVADTAAWMEPDANTHVADSRPAMTEGVYGVHGGSVLVLVAE